MNPFGHIEETDPNEHNEKPEEADAEGGEGDAKMEAGKDVLSAHASGDPHEVMAALMHAYRVIKRQEDQSPSKVGDGKSALAIALGGKEKKPKGD